MARKKRRTKRLEGDLPATSPPYRVLLPVSSLSEAEILLPLAQAIASEQNGSVRILHIVIVPEDHSLSEGAAEAIESRRSLNGFLADQEAVGAKIERIVHVTHEAWEEIWETVAQEKIDLLLLGWRSDVLPHTVVQGVIHSQLAAPPCDVVTVRPGQELAGPKGWKAVRDILLPLRGGPHAALGLRVAQAEGELADATITLLHVTGRATREADQELYATFGPALRGLERLTRSVTTVGDVAHAIIGEARAAQTVVMGAPSRRVHPDGWGGPLLDAVAEGLETTLIVVKERLPEPITSETAEQIVPAGHGRPMAAVVDKWFGENTFHSGEFASLERLLEQKKEQGLTLSLGLPALNEEKTVGKVIKTVRAALMEEVTLLDEIVLIDSGSVDYTREIAMELGIPVHIHQEILPQYGAYHGKGEALWKSLYVLKGDIIAWIDTDIRNIHPRFVYGVLGPLLTNPEIQYVKGFYRRPLRQGDKLVAGGGGRVTELTARPLINLFFPVLSGLIQPLSGEYAGRRTALERMPFFTGYGVETGLLIDILETFGLRAIAQVDLRRRVHHNKPLPSLSKMSFAILQVVIRRLEDRHKIRLMEDVNKTINLVRYERARYLLDMEEVRERERPPMISLPEYRTRHHRVLEIETITGE